MNKHQIINRALSLLCVAGFTIAAIAGEGQSGACNHEKGVKACTHEKDGKACTHEKDGKACCPHEKDAKACKTSKLNPQTSCPVMGEKIDTTLYYDYNGKKIYVCCAGCIGEVKKDPEKYLKKLEKMGQGPNAVSCKKACPESSKAQPVSDAKVMAAQTTCPVMGGKIDKASYVDHQGKRIYVCCAGCLGEIKKDPAKYIKKLEGMGQSVESVPVK